MKYHTTSQDNSAFYIWHSRYLERERERERERGGGRRRGGGNETNEHKHNNPPKTKPLTPQTKKPHKKTTQQITKETQQTQHPSSIKKKKKKKKRRKKRQLTDINPDQQTPEYYAYDRVKTCNVSFFLRLWLSHKVRVLFLSDYFIDPDALSFWSFLLLWVM